MSGHPDAGLYEALIEKLLHVQQRASSSKIDALTASFEALAGVLDFLKADARIVESEAARPLYHLLLAINDRIQGAKPKLFFDLPERPDGAPSYTSAVVLRTLVNAAFLPLCEVGMSSAEAGKWLAAELRLSGIKQPNGQAVDPRAVARWGAELGGKSPKGSDQAFGMFVHGAQSATEARQTPADSAPLDRQQAKEFARVMIKLMRIAGF